MGISEREHGFIVTARPEAEVASRGYTFGELMRKGTRICGEAWVWQSNQLGAARVQTLGVKEHAYTARADFGY